MKPLPTADQVAAKWAQRMADGTTAAAYRAGIAAVQQNPMAAAASAAAQEKYRAATAAAVNSGRMAAALNRADFGAWKQTATTTGAQNLAAGAGKGKPKMQRAATRLIPAWQAMQSAAAGVGPKTPGNAVARWTAAYQALMQSVGKA